MLRPPRSKSWPSLAVSTVLVATSLLGVGARAPFMHDGCASDLTGRFSAYCGGGDDHGKTSQLDQAQIADLVAYLESL